MARPEWALPAFSISVRGPSLPPRQAQVPATIASEHSLVHSVTFVTILEAKYGIEGQLNK